MNIFHNNTSPHSDTYLKTSKKIIPCIAAAFVLLILFVIVIFTPFFRTSEWNYETCFAITDNSTPSKLAKYALLKNPTITAYLRISDLEPESTAAMEVSKNPYNTLSIPTYLTKIGNLYFIVDCYHNQIIYHDNLTDSLTEWDVMTDQINRGHTLASDGLVYLADDTENNRILVFEERDGTFVHTQTFSDIGNRPHYIVYHEPTDTFYVWSSMNGEMYMFRHNPGDSRMYLTDIQNIATLSNTYVRSFTILENDIYFVSGYSCILRADLATFEILETYPVPESMAGMVQLTKIQDYFYITVSTDIFGNQDYATILRTQDLYQLIDQDYEDICGTFAEGGTPYYITNFDDTFYLTEHADFLWQFRVEDNEIIGVERLY